jgi:hypothetical protein
VGHLHRRRVECHAADSTFNTAKAEPLREPIRAALASWSACI